MLDKNRNATLTDKMHGLLLRGRGSDVALDTSAGFPTRNVYAGARELLVKKQPCRAREIHLILKSNSDGNLNLSSSVFTSCGDPSLTTSDDQHQEGVYTEYAVAVWVWGLNDSGLLKTTCWTKLRQSKSVWRSSPQANSTVPLTDLLCFSSNRLSFLFPNSTFISSTEANFKEEEREIWNERTKS